MDITQRNMTQAEHLYGYSQSQQLKGQTGCIGHLRVDMDTNGNGFFTTWDNHLSELNTPDFKEEFENVVTELRQKNGILSNRDTLAKYCYQNPDSKGDDHYGVRVDTEKHTYMVRLNPNRGEYNAYVYCYTRDWLDRHLQNAERGIRFIDSGYNEQFRIPDGGQITITNSNGEVDKHTCRYIDDYHVELGNYLYHICEFAERMERNGNVAAPVLAEVQGVGLWTAQQTIPLGDANLENVVAVLNPAQLKEPYKTGDNQLVLVTHGPGCNPGRFSDTVHLTFLKDGDRMACGRCDLMGIPKQEYLPTWAKEKMASIKKPTIQDKLRVGPEQGKQKTTMKPKEVER